VKVGKSKVNGGSSYPNQGDRDKDDVPGGKNVELAAYSKPVKYGAKAWKSKGVSNPKVPDYLA
jgi:hypothetical protein